MQNDSINYLAISIFIVCCFVIPTVILAVNATKRSGNFFKKKANIVNQKHSKGIKFCIPEFNTQINEKPPLKSHEFSRIIQENPEIILKDSHLQEAILIYNNLSLLRFHAKKLADLIPNLKRKAVVDPRALWLLFAAEIERDNQATRINPVFIDKFIGHEEQERRLYL
jgi:hypothetical protein